MIVYFDWDEQYPVYFQPSCKNARFSLNIDRSDWEEYVKALKIVNKMQNYIHEERIKSEDKANEVIDKPENSYKRASEYKK
jgi:hypothetical protein